MAETHAMHNLATVAEIDCRGDGVVLEEPRTDIDKQTGQTPDYGKSVDASFMTVRAAEKLGEMGLLEADRMGNYFGGLRSPGLGIEVHILLQDLIAGCVAFNEGNNDELEQIKEDAFSFLFSIGRIPRQGVIDHVKARLEEFRQTELNTHKDKSGSLGRLVVRGASDKQAINDFVDGSLVRSRRLAIAAYKL